jgi:RecJ-like exonuclease
MAASDTTYAVAKGAVEDVKTCQECFMTGNKWADKKCGADTTKKEKAADIKKANDADAALDTTITYDDFVTSALACADKV